MATIAEESMQETTACIPEVETENILSENLKNALDKVVNKSVQTLRFSVFARHFADVNKDNPESLQCIHEHLRRGLTQAISDEVDEMYTEENVKGHLDALLAIINAQNQPFDHQAWRPSGDPSKDVLAHIIPAKLKQKEKLEKVLSDCEKKNEKLVAKVLESRARLASLQKESEDRLKEFTEIDGVKIDEVEKYLETQIGS